MSYEQVSVYQACLFGPVRMIDVDQAPVFYQADELIGLLKGYCRASLAATNITLGGGEGFADISGSVQNNTSLQGLIIDALIKPIQPEGIPVFSVIGFAGEIKTGTAFIGFRPVGE